MHTFERIALWAVLSLVIFFLFFKNSSDFTANQPNLMSMNEFKWLPQPIRDSYALNMTKIINAVNPKFTSYWNSMPVANQQTLLSKLSTSTDQYVQMISSMSVDQLMMLGKSFPGMGGQGMPMVSPMASTQVMPMASPMASTQVMPMASTQVMPMASPQVMPMASTQVMPMASPMANPSSGMVPSSPLH